jgi:hypothetical protein
MRDIDGKWMANESQRPKRMIKTRHTQIAKPFDSQKWNLNFHAKKLTLNAASPLNILHVPGYL